MSLLAFRIGDFKAFAETQQVPIRPITLVYGANSAGKSSILHALLLARHGLENGDLDVHRMEIGGDAVDLGGFRQYVHRHEANRLVELGFELDVAELTRLPGEGPSTTETGVHGIQARKMRERLAELLSPVRSIGLSVRMGVALDNHGAPLRGEPPRVALFEMLADRSTILRMSRRPDGLLRLDRLDQAHPFVRLLLRSIVQSSTTTDTVRESDFDGLDEAVADAVPGIATAIKFLLPRGILAEPGREALFPVSVGNRRQDLANAVRYHLPRWLDEVLRGITDPLAGELGRIRYLGPLRSYPPRHIAFSQHHDPNWYAGGGYAWDVVRTDDRTRSFVNQWLCARDRLQTPYELVVRSFVDTDDLELPLREGLERLNEDGLVVKYEPPEMDDMKVYDEGGPYAEVQDLDVEAQSLAERIRESEAETLQDLILIDRRSNTVVSHRDVGIGVSQVLPVLVGAYASRGQIIAIEQPEIHLHPAIQADLGDLFLQSALGEQANRFLIETHSEHLLLRIMRRMRETHEKRLIEGLPPVTPEHVAVLFVERDGSRSIVREMPLNDRGELVKAWPGGFFEEGLREVFG